MILEALMPDTTSAKVLLLEDNPADTRFMQDSLRRSKDLSLELTHVAKLSDAERELTQGGYQLVITDLNLPDEDGLNTFFRVKEMAPDAAIMVMSGVSDRETGN